MSSKSSTLTERQQQIVGAILGGATNRQVADRLHIREQTVKNHLSQIYQKLGVENRLELAVLTLRAPGPTPNPEETLQA